MSGPQGLHPLGVAARPTPWAVVTKVERETGVAENSSASPNSERQRSGKLGPFWACLNPPAHSPHPDSLLSQLMAGGMGGRHLRCVQDGEKKLRWAVLVLGAAKRC